MLSVVFIFLASFFNAVSERLTGEHFKRSIFSNWLPCFWDRSISAKCMQRFCGYPLDAWFASQTSMVISIVSAIVFYSPIFTPFVDFLIYSGIWVMNFDAFYKLILRKK